MQRADRAEEAVNAVADAQEAGLRLEMQVGRVAIHRIGEQRVDEADDRVGCFSGSGRRPPVAGLFDFPQDVVDEQGVAVAAVDGAGDVVLAGQSCFDADGWWQAGTQFVEGDQVVDVGGGYRQVFGDGVAGDGIDAQTSGDLLRDQL